MAEKDKCPKCGVEMCPIRDLTGAAIAEAEKEQS